LTGPSAAATRSTEVVAADRPAARPGEVHDDRMRRLGDVAWRVVTLTAVWIVLGRAVGLLAGDTPDATIASAVATTALWYATAGAVALRDGRRRLLRSPYVTWVVVGLAASVLCVAWQWAARALSGGAADALVLRDDLVVLAPGLAAGVWVCAATGLALGRHDVAVRQRAEDDRDVQTDGDAEAERDAEADGAAEADQRPLTTSAARATHEVPPPRLSSRRSAAR